MLVSAIYAQGARNLPKNARPKVKWSAPNETPAHIHKGKLALPSKPWSAPTPVYNPNVKPRPARII